MVRISNKVLTETLLAASKSDFLENVMNEIHEEQGDDFATGLAFKGLINLDFVYGALIMYRFIKEAINEESAASLEKLFLKDDSR